MQQSIDQKYGTLIAAELYEILSLSTDIEIQTFSLTLKIMLNQGKVYDCLKFLTKKQFQKLDDQQEEINCEKINLESLHHLLKVIKEHNFNKTNYSIDIYRETRTKLIQKISNNVYLTEFLKFLVHLTTVDDTFVQSGSNALNLLVEMKVDLKKQQWQKIKIKNTSIVGANLAKCNLSESNFENVDMNGVNLNGALLFNCKWINIRVDEYPEINEHKNINSIKFSPDGKLLAFSSDFSILSKKAKGYILFWDVKAGKAQRQILLKNRIYSLYFSPNGAILASQQFDYGFIYLWNVMSRKMIVKSCGNSQHVTQACFSPDGVTLISSYRNYSDSLNLWDARTRKIKFQLNEQRGGVYTCCFSPDGTILASGGLEFIFLWEVGTGKLKSKLNGYLGFIKSLCFSPDGITLVSQSSDWSTYLWDVKTGVQIQKLESESKYEKQSVCFSPDGTILISVSPSCICLWDVKAGYLKQQLKKGQGAHQVCFSPDGKILAYCNSSIYLQNFKQTIQKQLFTIDQACYSPDGTILAAIGSDKSVSLWNAKTGELKFQLKGHRQSVTSICFSPDGSILASCSLDESICFWDVKLGEIKQKLNASGDCSHGCFSPDGAIFASTKNNNSLCLWNVKTGVLEQKIEYNPLVFSICFSPNGKMLAAGNLESSVNIFDVKLGEIILQLEGHRGCVNSICFSPDGSILASCSTDKSILLWDMQTGKIKLKLNGHRDGINSISFSPDGSILASASYDNSIYLWEVNTGKIMQSLKGNSGYFSSVCFSPDGTTLASCSSETCIRLWELNTDQHSQFIGYDYLKAYQQFNNQNILEYNPTVSTRFITQEVLFRAQEALIFQGEFVNHLGMNLKRLFKQKGSIIIIVEKQLK